MAQIKVKEFFDSCTSTLTYIVWDSNTLDAVLIDPVMDYDAAASKVSDKSAQLAINFIRDQKLKLHYILETHAHADHLSGAQLLKKDFPQARLAIGARIKEVQSTFKTIYNLDHIKTDGSQFDQLLQDNQIIEAGSMKIKVLYTSGHTPACVSYLVGNKVFTGDAIFIPDSGTGRCDFPKGSAEELFDSIQNKIYSLPDTTEIYVGHDYQPGGRQLIFQTTVREEKASNIQLKAQTTKPEFVSFRQERDRTLTAPKLLLPSLQVNIDAGRLPLAESNGKSYLKIPIGFST